MYGGYQQFKKIHLLKSPKCSFLLINILLQLATVCHALYSLHGGALKPHVAPQSGEKTPEKPLPAAVTAPVSLTAVGMEPAAVKANLEGSARA